MAAPSEAWAGGTDDRMSPLVPENGDVIAVKEIVTARRNEVAAFPTRSIMLSVLSMALDDDAKSVAAVLSAKRVLS